MIKLPDADAMYRDMAAKLGKHVRCRGCGRFQEVDPEKCLRHGWPMCCGETMALTLRSEDNVINYITVSPLPGSAQ